MAAAISIFLGFIIGATVWPAFRLIPAVARWLCQPFGPPGPLTRIVALIISSLFLLLAIITIFDTAYRVFVLNGGVPSPFDQDKVLRRYMLASSLFGAVFLGLSKIMDDLLRRMNSRIKQRNKKAGPKSRS
jgi:ABC-type Fe3+ transport system permease subunit